MNLPATAQEKKNDLRSIITSDAMKKQFAMALPKHLTVDRLMRMAVTTLHKTPKLLECTQESVLACFMDCAQLGLEPDNVLGRAYVVPYKGKAQLIIGYKGLIDLAYRSGQVEMIQTAVVHENDLFVYEMGLDPKLQHKPSDNPGKATHAYSVVKLKGGAQSFHVMNKAQIEHIRDTYSAGWKSGGDSPWKSEPDEQWRKTVFRNHAKYLPLSAEFHEAAGKDEATSTYNFQDVMASQAKPAERFTDEAPAVEAVKETA